MPPSRAVTKMLKYALSRSVGMVDSVVVSAVVSVLMSALLQVCVDERWNVLPDGQVVVRDAVLFQQLLVECVDVHVDPHVQRDDDALGVLGYRLLVLDHGGVAEEADLGAGLARVV